MDIETRIRLLYNFHCSHGSAVDPTTIRHEMLDFFLTRENILGTRDLSINDIKVLVDLYLAIPASMLSRPDPNSHGAPSSPSPRHVNDEDIAPELPELSEHSPVPDNIVVDRLIRDDENDPARHPDAEFAVDRRPEREILNEDVVDDAATCPTFSCTEPAATGFRHCTTHVDFAHKKLRIPRGQHSARWIEQYNFLREWKASCDKGVGEIWGINVEYVVLNFATPLAFSICIKRYKHNTDVINTRVGYDGATAEEILDVYADMAPDDFELDKRVKNSLRSAFKSYYPEGRAEGMSFMDMREASLTAGFDPRTHAVISWSTTLDLQVFFKALSGINKPFVAPTVRDNFQLQNGLNYFTSLQSINIQHLAKNMMRAKPKKGFALTEVYRALFGIKDVEAHLAPCDTIMELDILRIVASFSV